jgi:hypothetical protein
MAVVASRKNTLQSLCGNAWLLRPKETDSGKSLRGVPAGSGTTPSEARARIAAAQRARWAKVREKAKVVPIRRKRTLSVAARRKIAASQGARWARVKAGKKGA